jgi:hypothetical protein
MLFLLMITDGEILCDYKTITRTQPAECLVNNIEWKYESKVVINNTIYDQYKSYKITGDVVLNNTVVFKNYDFTKKVDPIVTTHYYNNFTFNCFVIDDEIYLRKIENQICQNNNCKKGFYISSIFGLFILILVFLQSSMD